MFSSEGKEAVRHFKFLWKFIMSWKNIFYYLENTYDLLTHRPCKCGLWSPALTSCWDFSVLIFLVCTLSLSCRHLKISACFFKSLILPFPVVGNRWLEKQKPYAGIFLTFMPAALQTCLQLPFSAFLLSQKWVFFFSHLCVFWIPPPSLF